MSELLNEELLCCGELILSFAVRENVVLSGPVLVEIPSMDYLVSMDYMSAVCGLSAHATFGYIFITLLLHHEGITCANWGGVLYGSSIISLITSHYNENSGYK